MSVQMQIKKIWVQSFVLMRVFHSLFTVKTCDSREIVAPFLFNHNVISINCQQTQLPNYRECVKLLLNHRKKEYDRQQCL